LSTDSAFLYISTSSVSTDDCIEAGRQLSGITENIELSGGCLHDENLLEQLMELRRQKSINFLVHSYFPPPHEHFVLNFADTGRKTRSFIKETMCFVDALDIDYYSIHAGFKKTFILNNEVLFKSGDTRVFALEDIEENLEWFAREFPGKKLALENLYNRECCFMVHIDEIVSMMDSFPDIYLLLDLGHLKISSGLLGFDYLDATAFLLERYAHRILEIHLSENNAMADDHFILHPDSIQHMIIREYARLITMNKINITIESRNSGLQDLSECFAMINRVLANSRQCEHAA